MCFYLSFLDFSSFLQIQTVTQRLMKRWKTLLFSSHSPQTSGEFFVVKGSTFCIYSRGRGSGNLTRHIIKNHVSLMPWGVLICSIWQASYNHNSYILRMKGWNPSVKKFCIFYKNLYQLYKFW